MFEYRAKVISVYDGDTVTVDIDLGFGIWLRDQKLRLSNINAPEVRGSSREEGLKSRDALREKILDKNVIIKTMKDKKGKYGRWIAEIYIDDSSINTWLVKEGFAKTAEY